MKTLLFTAIAVSTFSSAAHAGLDIVAYEGLKEIKEPVFDKEGIPIGKKLVQLSPVEFKERYPPLKPDAVYKYRVVFDFRAGSYSGYNWWRNELAKLAGYEATLDEAPPGKEPSLRYDLTVWTKKAGPFWELIDFSDAEGVIGSTACLRVHKDFLRFAPAAAKHPEPDFRDSYRDWQKAFAMCSRQGAIVFQ